MRISGQIAAQPPQPTHLSGSEYGLPFSTRIAVNPHADMQTRQSSLSQEITAARPRFSRSGVGKSMALSSFQAFSLLYHNNPTKDK
jgi:hypothetical protein